MTESYFKVHEDETYPLTEAGVQCAIKDYNDVDELFDAYINDNNDEFEVCGYRYDASEAFKNCSEYDYDAEKEEWLNSKTQELLSELEGFSLGEQYTDSETNDTYTICNEDGSVEATPSVSVTVPENAEAEIDYGENVVKLKWEEVGTVDGEEKTIKHTVALPKNMAKEIAKLMLM